MTRRTNPTFWMIYGLGQGAPTARHMTRDAAEDEASRLARSHPGIKFFVLEAVTVVERSDLRIHYLDDPEDDGIPF